MQIIWCIPNMARSAAPMTSIPLSRRWRILLRICCETGALARLAEENSGGINPPQPQREEAIFASWYGSGHNAADAFSIF
jgi:hypothetical protein